MSQNDPDHLPATQTFKAAPRLPEPEVEPLAEPETESSAADRLRAFEDEKLGEGTPRFNGQIEKGHGSFFKDDKIFTDADRAHHAALERLVEAEKQLAEAHAALADAEDSYAAAERAVGE